MSTESERKNRYEPITPIEELALQMREILLYVDPNINTINLTFPDKQKCGWINIQTPEEWRVWRNNLFPGDKMFITRVIHTLRRAGCQTIMDIKSISLSEFQKTKIIGLGQKGQDFAIAAFDLI